MVANIPQTFNCSQFLGIFWLDYVGKGKVFKHQLKWYTYYTHVLYIVHTSTDHLY
jgi:hypothetical protein